MNPASASVRRLVERHHLNPSPVALMLAYRYGFTRRDVTPAGASRRPATTSNTGGVV
jgi:hypothetical protein